MLVRRYSWTAAAQWSDALPDAPDSAPQLILSFGPVETPDAAWFAKVHSLWPAAEHVYCSGGGQISDSTVDDDVTVVTVIRFDHATVHPVVRDGASLARSAALGAEIGAELAPVVGLQHVLLFAEGLALNGAAFVAALNDALPDAATVSGGLASNGIELTKTVIGLNGTPSEGRIVAIGLAGESLAIGTGSVGGWDLFGPERVVTRSETAIVYELDGENALEVYKRYLGNFASELPGIALTFPLAVRAYEHGPLTVRTILAIDESIGSLRFAGDIPEGSMVRLMRTTTDKLIEGAGNAARLARSVAGDTAPSLTLCISCIGRRAVMRSRVEEELDEIVLAIGGSPVVGFYSNGEIAPPSDGRTFAKAVLHNQTMTVTTIGER
jgi:hypothetical protein